MRAVFYARICLYLNTKQEDGFCFCPFDFRFPRDALFVAPLCPHLADKNTTFARLYFHTNSAQFSHPLRVDAPAPPRSVINIVNVEVYLSSSPLPLFIIYNIIINMYTHTHAQCVFLMGFSLLSLSLFLLLYARIHNAHSFSIPASYQTSELYLLAYARTCAATFGIT